ncbi:MAG: hypothetical protein ACU0E9_04745 [Limimaricola soesokkakensis]|uniref:hypothetical protein n=1 Tax=Limimaricola soesokkakensis TaxID=1343159 RepID=UPI004058BFEC
MKLTLSPRAAIPGEVETIAFVSGDILTVNGVPYDLSAIPDGGEGMPEGNDHPFSGVITRKAGVIHAMIRWVYAEDALADQPAWPVADVSDGPVPSPVVKTPAPAPEEQPA